MSRATELTTVDDLVNRLVRALRRPSYRSRILNGVSQIPGAEALRVLRSVELRERGGQAPSIRDVAGDIEVEQPTASRAVKALVDRDLIHRTPDVGDGRRVLLGLTVTGREELARATANRLGLLADLTGDWPVADVREFARLLDRFVRGYEEAESSR